MTMLFSGSIIEPPMVVSLSRLPASVWYIITHGIPCALPAPHLPELRVGVPRHDVGVAVEKHAYDGTQQHMASLPPPHLPKLRVRVPRHDVGVVEEDALLAAQLHLHRVQTIVVGGAGHHSDDHHHDVVRLARAKAAAHLRATGRGALDEGGAREMKTDAC